MNKLILATGSDFKYLERIQPYLKSLETNSNFDENILVLLSDDDYKLDSPKILLAKQSPSSVRALSPINCTQHGEFIFAPYFDKFKDNDIIFYTDGDMNIQRNITEVEREMYSNFKDGDVYIGYNASPTDTLYDEAPRIGYNGRMFPEFFNDNWREVKVYNTGLIAMNKKTWKRLANDYVPLYPLVDVMFSHYAKQQWLISFLINTKPEYNVMEMPYDIHNHRHYSSPEGTRQDSDGNVYFEDKLVLFKHRWG
jgi:calcineurin-like phosphoesterase family protein